jgi:RNA polymerase sigma-70 factor (ECF subfamily)
MDDTETEFEELHDAFRPRILRYLGRLVSESEAEDLTQEVFVKVHQALPGFRGESKISTWLYRIATNTALDRLRNAARRESPEPEDAAGEEAMNECIREFILGLPENYRTVLVLGDLEGLQDREIAEVLGVSLQTAKVRLHRARERLKRELQARCELSWREGDDSPPCARKPPADPK